MRGTCIIRSPPPPAASRRRSMAHPRFRAGAEVEITSPIHRLRGTLFPGRIVAPSRRKPNSFLVEYRTLVAPSDAGRPSRPYREEVPVGLLRPAPPAEAEAGPGPGGRGFRLGDAVDAFLNGGWWEGAKYESHQWEYLGLTGARLDGAEMLACGLATHFVPSAKLPSLEAALHTVDSSDQAVISAIIGEYSELPMLKEQSAYHRLDVINRCFSRRTVEDILSALEREATNKVDGWILASIQSLKKASPTSLKISLRSIREGRLQGVGQCLVREYRMVCHVIRGEVSKDFVEGCRAILVDKDRNPKWEPPRLELLSDKMVDKYFSKVDDEDWEDLKLPPRSNLPASAMAKL